MGNTLLVLDVDNLSYRNFFSPFRGAQKSPLVYGLLRDMGTLSRLFRTTDFVFCFDGGAPDREAAYPDYKRSRKAHPDRGTVRAEIDRVRVEVLPAVGMENLLFCPGAEADDLMALACRASARWDEVVLVSSDTDLYQLLQGERVKAYSMPSRKLTTEESLMGRFGTTPLEWAAVKAIAGCETDGVKGVGGIGLVRARQYLHGDLPEGGRHYKSILAGRDIIERNRPLVTLPYHTVRHKVRLSRCRFIPAGWRAMCEQYDSLHLIGGMPTEA